MATAHIESRKEDIGEIVLLPGDPLRAKYIAEHFLEDYRLVNSVRNMYAYTGTYKGKMITVFSSGMGIPSVGIYAYELFKFYDVKKIIRIGTCGNSFSPPAAILNSSIIPVSVEPGNNALTLIPRRDSSTACSAI